MSCCLLSQWYFNQVLPYYKNKMGMDIQVLDPTVYPSGAMWETFKETAAWYHANQHQGHFGKQAYMQDHGLWLSPFKFEDDASFRGTNNTDQQANQANMS